MGEKYPPDRRKPKNLLDPVEALHHIKTLARAAQGITDMDTAQKHFEMILTLVDKALPKTRKRMR